MNQYQKLSVSSAPGVNGSWTTAMVPAVQQYSDGNLNLSISGTWVGTVTIQRKFQDEDDYFDVDTFTANVETFITEFEHGVAYRLGMKNLEYTSGTVNLRLSR